MHDANAANESDDNQKRSTPATLTLQIGGDEFQKSPKDTEESIGELRDALKVQRLDIGSISDPNARSVCLTQLGMTGMRIFGRFGSLDVLNAAVEDFEEAVNLTQTDHVGALNNLAMPCLSDFRKQVPWATSTKRSKRAKRQLMERLWGIARIKRCTHALLAMHCTPGFVLINLLAGR